LVKANFLASPPLVVAYALAGTVDVDLVNEPVGEDEMGNEVYLRDIWPSSKEIVDTIKQVITPELFQNQYDGIEQSNEEWNAIRIPEGSIYEWSTESTYIQEPPFFIGLTRERPETNSIEKARVLVKVGNSTTTDHISPAGSIPAEGPAGIYLQDHDVKVHEFNSFGSRRGNHEVMMRGTFANIRLRNQIAPGTEGGWTTYFPTGDVEPIYDAAMKYIESDTDLVVIAGREYGTGSSRDWAAKGTQLLGVKAVLAESFERIHRSNLVGMGVLPLQFKKGEKPSSLGLDGSEAYDIPLNDDMKPGEEIQVTATKGDGTTVEFTMDSRLDTPVEVDYYQHGGILNYVLRDFLGETAVTA
jgi:aconitate hydratase